MYDSPELFEAAFTLLFAQFSQREAIIFALGDVQLIVTDKVREFSTLDKLNASVSTLRNRMES